MRKQNWMTWISTGLVLLMGIASIYAASNPIVTGRAQPGSGWVLTASDDDIDTSAELITELDTTFVQMAAASTIYAVSTQGADTTQTLYVTGVSSGGKLITASWTLTGTSAVAASSETFSYVDQIWLSAECAGVVSVNVYDDPATLINSIDVGSLKGDVAQHFNGRKTTYVRRWWASSETASSKLVELRWYPDDADCLDSGDGFTLLDKIYMANSIYRSEIHLLGDSRSGLKLPAGGWLAVFATGGAADQEVTVTVIGQDRRR